MKILNKTNLKILSIETAGMAEMKTQASCSSQQPSYGALKVAIANTAALQHEHLPLQSAF